MKNGRMRLVGARSHPWAAHVEGRLEADRLAAGATT